MLLGRSLRRHVLPLLRRHTSTSSMCVIDTVSNQMARIKEKLGGQVMIVSGSDDRSMQLRQKMWVVLQQIGVQSVFSTVVGQYPNPETLEEMALMTKRSGAKSIIAVGSTSVLQAAAAVRQGFAEKITITEKTVTSRDNLTGNSATLIFPLVFVPTDLPSPGAYFSHAVISSSPTSDVLSWLWTNPAELVIHDKQWQDLSSLPRVQSAFIAALGDLIDTVHAAVYASTTHTAWARQNLTRPNSNKQQVGWNAAHSVLLPEDDWETAIQEFLMTEMNRLEIAKCISNISTDDPNVLWKDLCHLSQRIGELRSAMESRFKALEFTLNMATPIQMRSAYETLRIFSLSESFSMITARNVVNLLKFTRDERSRVNNARVDNDALLPHYALLKTICLIMPLVMPHRESRYSYLNKRVQRESLGKDDELYNDINGFISMLEPMTAPAPSQDSSKDLMSYEELRLAEEINMEDRVYSDEQIKRAMTTKGPRVILDKDEDGETYFRLNYIKSEVFYDFCSAFE